MERHGAQPSANAVDWVHISNVFHTSGGGGFQMPLNYPLLG